MKYTDYSIEAILEWNSKQEMFKKREIKEEIIDSEIMKYYNREKYPTLDQLEQISLKLDIKISTIKTWYLNKRQHERNTSSRTQKCSMLPISRGNHTFSPEATTSPAHQRTITPPQQRTITPLQQIMITPPQQRTITSPSFIDGSDHPYFKLISEKIGYSPPQIDEHDKPRISASQHVHPAQQSSPVLPYQKFQNKMFPGSPTVPQVLPLYHPFSQRQLYYDSPYLQYPVSTPSSLGNIQPLDLSKPVRPSSPENHGIKQSNGRNRPISQSSPENHGIKQSNGRDRPISQSSPENHGIKQSNSPDQLISQSSPENHGIKQSNSPDQPDRIRPHSPNNLEKQSSLNLSNRTHQTSPDHQARTKTTPEPVNQTSTKNRTVPNKTSKTRSTPIPKLSDVLSPPVKPNFGSGLRQLVIEGRSFSP